MNANFTKAILGLFRTPLMNALHLFFINYISESGSGQACLTPLTVRGGGVGDSEGRSGGACMMKSRFVQSSGIGGGDGGFDFTSVDGGVPGGVVGGGACVVSLTGVVGGVVGGGV